MRSGNRARLMMTVWIRIAHPQLGRCGHRSTSAREKAGGRSTPAIRNQPLPGDPARRQSGQGCSRIQDRAVISARHRAARRFGPRRLPTAAPTTSTLVFSLSGCCGSFGISASAAVLRAKRPAVVGEGRLRQSIDHRSRPNASVQHRIAAADLFDRQAFHGVVVLILTRDDA